jgi:hypothetical protein
MIVITILNSDKQAFDSITSQMSSQRLPAVSNYLLAKDGQILARRVLRKANVEMVNLP